MGKVFSSKHAFPLVCLILFFVVFASIFFPLVKATHDNPGKPLYGFPMSFMGDYYTDVFRIRLGQMGILQYSNAYSDEDIPPTLFEPHYNVVGLLTKPLGIQPLLAYELFRIICIAAYLLAIYFLIGVTLSSSLERILAALFFTFATSMWGISKISGVLEVINPQLFPKVYTDYFTIFTRYNTLKAHHFLADAVLIGIIIAFTHGGLQKRILVFLGLGSVALSFLHPYVMVYLWIFLGISIGIDILIYKKIPREFLLKAILIVGISLPFILYQGFVLMHYFRAPTDMYGTFLWTVRTISFLQYLLACGLVLITATGAIFIRTFWTNHRHRILLVWGFVPFILFLLTDLHIPMSPYRLFQTNQLIPLAILSGACIPRILRRIRLPITSISVFIIFVFVLYSIPSYAKSFEIFTSPNQYYFYTQNIHSLSLPVYMFLKQHTPKQSIVLAGENVSMIMPIYTDNRVFMGHPGTTPDFDTKKAVGMKILSGQASSDELIQLLKKYRIKYVVFGIENLPFSSRSYVSSPFLKEIYHQENGVSVVEVF